MKNWNQLIIKKDESLREVIKTLNNYLGQIVLVCDDNKKLLGTITDGDLRRGLLAGHDLTSKAQSIMHKEFMFCNSETDKESALLIMQENYIFQLPILDSDGQVLGLYLRDELNLPVKRKNPVVIMAGGLGRRLKPLTNNCPKPMLPVSGKPILETIIENLKLEGFEEFYISVNYLSEKIVNYFADGSKWGVKIEYIHEKNKIGTAGALGNLNKQFSEPIVVMNGDVLTRVNFSRLLDYHQDTKAFATVCLREYESEVPYGVVKLDGIRIKDIVEKPITRHFVSAGIYVLDKSVFSYLKRNTYKDMPDLLRELIMDEKVIGGFPVHEYWLDVGQQSQFDKALSEFEQVFKND